MQCMRQTYSFVTIIHRCIVLIVLLFLVKVYSAEAINSQQDELCSEVTDEVNGFSNSDVGPVSQANCAWAPYVRYLSQIVCSRITSMFVQTVTADDFPAAFSALQATGMVYSFQKHQTFFSTW